MWLVVWASPGRIRPLANVVVPPVFLSAFFVLLFSYRFLRFLLLPESSYTVTRLSEWSELCLAWGLASFVVLLLRRLHGTGRGAPLVLDGRAASIPGVRRRSRLLS